MTVGNTPCQGRAAHLRVLQVLVRSGPVPWFHAVAEHSHEIQNPISAAKIRLLGEQIGLAPGQRVLDTTSS